MTATPPPISNCFFFISYLNHVVYLVLAAKFHLNNCSIFNDKPAEKVVPLVAGELL